MKILTYVGSYRKQGNTGSVVSLIEDRLHEMAQEQGEPLEIKRLTPGAYEVLPCRGCRVCFDRGESHCPLKDDLVKIRDEIDWADGIIMASPVYVNDVSGAIKVLIDRLAYVCHRPAFIDKNVYLIATTGGSPCTHTLRTLQSAWLSWGANVVGSAGFRTGALTARDEIATRYRRKIDRVADRFFRAVRRKAHTRPGFVRLMMFKIQQWSWRQADPASVDFRYWDAQGWTDRRRNFFIDHETGPLTVALARFVGGVLARVMN